MIRFLLALFATIVVEALVTPLLLPPACRRKVVIDGICINLVTNPLANLLVAGFGVPFLGVEASVVVAEAILYLRISRLSAGRAWRLSLAANALTAALSFAF